MEFKNQPYRRVGRHDANPHALKNIKLINQHIPNQSHSQTLGNKDYKYQSIDAGQKYPYSNNHSLTMDDNKRVSKSIIERENYSIAAQDNPNQVYAPLDER